MNLKDELANLVAQQQPKETPLEVEIKNLSIELAAKAQARCKQEIKALLQSLPDKLKERAAKGQTFWAITLSKTDGTPKQYQHPDCSKYPHYSEHPDYSKALQAFAKENNLKYYHTTHISRESVEDAIYLFTITLSW